MEAGVVSGTPSVLPRSPLFAQLDVNALEEIRRNTHPRRCAAGDVICREGASNDSI